MATILASIAGLTLGAATTGFFFAGGAELFRYSEDKFAKPDKDRAHNRIDKNMKKDKKEKGKEKEISLKELEQAIK